MTVGIADRQEPIITDPGVDETRKNLDLAPPKPVHSRCPDRNGDVGACKGTVCPERLKPLSKRRITDAEHQPKLRLFQFHQQQEQRRSQRGRERDPVVLRDAAHGINATGHDTLVEISGFPSPAAPSGASKKRPVPTRGSMGAALEQFVLEDASASQGRQNDVVREVLGFVRHTAVSPRNLHQSVACCSKVRHRVAADYLMCGHARRE